MPQEFSHSNQTDQLHQHLKKLFARQTRRELLLPVSVPDAQHRLQIAFADTISVSRGFLFANYNYTGQVHDTKIDVQFTIRGRSSMHYIMHGQLFPDGKGCRLVMIVKDENSFLFLLVPIFIVGFLAFNRIGAAPVIFAAIITGLSLPLQAWHRNSAADKISGLIYEIVSKRM